MTLELKSLKKNAGKEEMEIARKRYRFIALSKIAQ